MLRGSSMGIFKCWTSERESQSLKMLLSKRTPLSERVGKAWGGVDCGRLAAAYLTKDCWRAVATRCNAKSTAAHLNNIINQQGKHHLPMKRVGHIFHPLTIKWSRWQMQFELWKLRSRTSLSIVGSVPVAKETTLSFGRAHDCNSAVII